MGQLATAKAKLSEINSTTEQAKVKIAHLTKELKEKEPRAKKAATEGGDLTTELKTAKADLKKLESRMEALGAGAEADDALDKQYSELTRQVQQLKAQHDGLRSTLARLDFNYTSPSREFDRKKVKGMVANLVSLSDKHSDKSTALEVCAGGRLYNVVVDDDGTGSELLNKGQLTQRVTLIPLNKIQPHKVPAYAVDRARQISSGKASLAVDLIDYPQEVSQAMSFVFGSTFICPDPATAKSVCFDNQIKMKTVTLEGDVYNPSGSLEGGAAPANSEMLVKVKRTQEIQKTLATTQAKLEAVARQWTDFQERQAEKASLQTQLDLKRHEVSELEARMADSNAARVNIARDL
jgi:structural maintenance of chromosome 2